MGDPPEQRDIPQPNRLTIVVAPAGRKIASRAKPSSSSSRAPLQRAGSLSREAPVQTLPTAPHCLRPLKRRAPNRPPGATRQIVVIAPGRLGP